MNKKIILILTFLSSVLLFSQSFLFRDIEEVNQLTEKGIVRYVNEDCGYLVITFSKGKNHVVGEDKNSQSNAGDIVRGFFNELGEQNIYNETQKKGYIINIGEASDNRDSAYQIIEEKCDEKLPSWTVPGKK